MANAIESTYVNEIAEKIYGIVNTHEYIEFYEGNYENVRDCMYDNPSDYAQFVFLDFDPHVSTNANHGRSEAYGFDPEVMKVVREKIESALPGVLTDYPDLLGATWKDREYTLELRVYKDDRA